MKENVVQNKSYKFALRIVKLYKYLIDEKKEFVMSKQLLRCGTSIGANIEEGLGGVSDADFKHKLSIAYKEARETGYWLKLLKNSEFITEAMFDSIFTECDEICKILYSIIQSLKNK
ncbi:MAG: four helix bundle protein [Ignavibacteria bacterium]|nr:four helix bundle protein [Ignavibacteria bacterium]